MSPKQLPTQAPLASNPAILNALDNKPGWKHKTSGQWVHAKADVTVQQDGPHQFTVTHAGTERVLTSATGAVLVAEQLVDKAQAE